MEKRPASRPEPEDRPDPDLDLTVDLREHEPPSPDLDVTVSLEGRPDDEDADEPEGPEPAESATPADPEDAADGGTEAAAEDGEDTDEPEPQPAADSGGDDHHDHGPGRRNLAEALWPPRFSRNQVVVGILLAVLGAALAIQVRAANSDQLLRGARPDDLVNILDNVTSRGQKLDSELRDLQNQQTQLQNSTDKAQAALQQAQEKARTLEILAGTVKAQGPGITVTVPDPQHKVDAAALLNTLEELRAAGAEVVQVGDVRIVVSSSFVDTGAGLVSLDGKALTAPYVFKVIGDPSALKPALGIPGGVVEAMSKNYGSTVAITTGTVLVDALAAAPDPQYAKNG